MVHAVRRKGRSRSRILYWFRTPPGVRVGRAALDEQAIRLIEARNPDVQFDWARILKGEVDAEESSERRTPDRPRERRAPQSQRPDSPAKPVAARSAGAPPAGRIDEALSGPGAIEKPAAAAYQRLGAEGLVRLRGRHASMLARIDDRIADEARRAELKELAERLNPDSWVTDADVRAGLEEYEATFERVRNELGGRPKVTAATDAIAATPPDAQEQE